MTKREGKRQQREDVPFEMSDNVRGLEPAESKKKTFWFVMSKEHSNMHYFVPVLLNVIAFACVRKTCCATHKFQLTRL